MVSYAPEHFEHPFGLWGPQDAQKKKNPISPQEISSVVDPETYHVREKRHTTQKPSRYKDIDTSGADLS